MRPRQTLSLSSGVRRIKGGYSAAGRKFGIVVSEFNEYLTSRLLDGALDTLLRHGARLRDIRVVYVPGAFEIPLVAKRLVRQGRFDAILTLGVVIRGQTRHFNQVVAESARGIRELSERSEIPVILGILSAETAAQAMHRIGIKQTNKGREWAMAAIEMANLMRRLGGERRRLPAAAGAR